MAFRLTVGVVLLAAAAPNLSLADDSLQLPDVESVLTRAANKVQSFTAQAAAMQARVAQKQAQRRAEMAAQKMAYEQRLRAQAEENQAVSDANVGIQKQIGALGHANEELRQKAGKLQKDNGVLRDALAQMQQKVKVARLFINNSIVATDDTKAEALKVLEPEKPKPTLSRFLRVAGGADEDDSDEVSSLLQLSSRRIAGDAPDATKAEDYVPILSRSLLGLAAAEKEGEEQLRAHFVEAFEQGNQRRSELNATQTSLVETRSSLEGVQQRLFLATDHLKGTRKQLQQRLQGMRVFAEKVGKVTADALQKASSVEGVSKLPASSAEANKKSAA